MRTSSPRLTTPLVGHDALVDQLKTLATTSRLPHGLLFHGPKGVGKATAAYHLARFLFAGHDVPPQDPLYKRVGSGAHGDLLVLEPERDEDGRQKAEISIESVRGAVHFLQTTPLEGGYRVVIIDSVDQMNRKAANALLKSLEEPPARTILILISHAIQKVPVTLRSRCRPIAFGRLKDEALAPLFPEPLSPICLNYAHGCPGRAYEFQAVGVQAFYKSFLQMMSDLCAGTCTSTLDFIEAYAIPSPDRADAYPFVTQFLCWWMERLLQYQAGLKDGIVPREAALFDQLLARHPLSFWLAHLTRAVRTFHDPRFVGLDRKAALSAYLLACAQGESAYDRAPEFMA